MPHYKEGIYRVEIMDQGLNVSKNKGTPGFYLRILPDDGAYERDIQWWLTDKTIEYFIRDMQRLGFRGTSPSELDPNSEGHHSFVGQVIEAACSHEENDGKVYERWQLPFEGAREVVPMDRKAARKLDALFGKQFKAAFGGNAGTQQTKPQESQEASKPLTTEEIAKATQEALEADDSEVPF